VDKEKVNISMFLLVSARNSIWLVKLRTKTPRLENERNYQLTWFTWKTAVKAMYGCT